MPIPPRVRRLLWSLPLLAVVGLLILVGSSWIRPDGLGLVAGKLRPCPNSPNCVCSQDPRESAYVDPLAFEGNAGEALDRLRKVLSSLPGTTVIRDEGGYLHAECATAWLRFVDDVEFLVDEGAQVIHVRSASRVGYSDMGANRARVETIRAAFAAAK